MRKIENMANDKPKDEKPKNADKVALRNFLVAKGISTPQANQLAGVSNANTKRADWTRDIAAHTNALPKAKEKVQGVTPETNALLNAAMAMARGEVKMPTPPKDEWAMRAFVAIVIVLAIVLAYVAARYAGLVP